MSNLPPPTDCLVLKIMEFSVLDQSVDTILYILYDKEEHRFIIRGKRNNEEITFNSYSFECKYAHELEPFIRILIGRDNKVLIDLINYQELPLFSDDITFEYLEENDTTDNQLVAFSPSTYRSKRIKSALRCLRNVYNHYQL
jgi:hypothetical protein